MRKVLNKSLDVLAYAIFFALTMAVIWYVTPGKAWAHELRSGWNTRGTVTSCSADRAGAQARYRDGTWRSDVLGVPKAKV